MNKKGKIKMKDYLKGHKYITKEAEIFLIGLFFIDFSIAYGMACWNGVFETKFLLTSIILILLIHLIIALMLTAFDFTYTLDKLFLSKKAKTKQNKARASFFFFVTTIFMPLLLSVFLLNSELSHKEIVNINAYEYNNDRFKLYTDKGIVKTIKYNSYKPEIKGYLTPDKNEKLKLKLKITIVNGKLVDYHYYKLNEIIRDDGLIIYGKKIEI
jgi:succinate dehydrogenase/fumarate reductase cytochrome b subunit